MFEGQARAALKTAIVATGMYDDEAQAMVDTWTRSWFGNVGLRVPLHRAAGVGPIGCCPST